jgi:hypothetical protein
MEACFSSEYARSLTFNPHSLSDWGSFDEADNVVLGNRNDHKVLIFDQHHSAGRRSSRRTIVGGEVKGAAERNVSGEAVSWDGAEGVGPLGYLLR